MSLVDAQMLEAYRRSLAPVTQAQNNLSKSITGGVQQIGEALGGRYQDLQQKRREIDHYKRALGMEEENASRERNRLNEVGPMRPHEAAQRDAQIMSLDKRLGEIGTTQDRLGKIGDVRFRNVYDKTLPGLAERDDYDADAAYKDIGLQAKQDAILSDQNFKGLEAQKVRDHNAAEAEKTRQHQIALQRIRNAHDAKQRLEDRAWRESNKSNENLSVAEKSDIVQSKAAVESLTNVANFVQENRGHFGPLEGRLSAIKEFFTGEGPINKFENLRGQAVKIFGKLLEGGKLAEGDQKVYEALAGDHTLSEEQIISNVSALGNSTFDQAIDKARLLPDGPEKSQAIEDLNNAKLAFNHSVRKRAGGSDRSKVQREHGEQLAEVPGGP